jgi:hypothetical protein
MPRGKAGKETIDFLIQDWEKFYDKKLNTPRRDFYALQMAKLDEDDLCRAGPYIKQREVVFPTVQVIEKYTHICAEERWERDKKNAPGMADLRKSGESTPNGRDALDLMYSLYDGRRYREQYLARMYELDNKYPNFGWNVAANDLKKFWQDEPERHATGNRYLERIFAEIDSRRNLNRNKIHQQLEWLKDHTSDSKLIGDENVRVDRTKDE